MTQHSLHGLRESANSRTVAFAVSIVDAPGGPTACGLRG